MPRTAFEQLMYAPAYPFKYMFCVDEDDKCADRIDFIYTMSCLALFVLLIVYDFYRFSKKKKK